MFFRAPSVLHEFNISNARNREKGALRNSAVDFKTERAALKCKCVRFDGLQRHRRRIAMLHLRSKLTVLYPQLPCRVQLGAVVVSSELAKVFRRARVERRVLLGIL